ncbi:MAG: FtsB family cell division protein [Alphaproteobacteria bacterium]
MRWRVAITASLAALFLTLYFFYHALHGERGLSRYYELRQEVSKAEEKLARLQEENLKLEKRVQALRPESLDLDLLDERAREVLNYALPDDMVLRGNKKLVPPPVVAPIGGLDTKNNPPDALATESGETMGVE